MRREIHTAPTSCDPTILIARQPRSVRPMMAFDRTPSVPTLDPATVDALRAALARSVKQGNHADELRLLLCKAADEARTKGITAERLLILLKDIWYGLPEV